MEAQTGGPEAAADADGNALSTSRGHETRRAGIRRGRNILAHNLDLVSALRLKARHAAETGEVFIPLEDLLSRS